MAVSLSNGSLVSIATAYAAALVVSAATNAAETVLTVTNTLVSGDVVEFTSGWARANGRLFRVKTPTGGTVVLEGLDTLSTVRFPVGSGGGTIRKINTFTQIAQMLELTSSGGEPQFTTFSFLEQDFETQIPTTTSAQNVAYTIADDPTLPGYAAVKLASETRLMTGLRLSLPSGSTILYNGIFAFDETPTLTKNEVMACRGAIALQNRPTRYLN